MDINVNDTQSIKYDAVLQKDRLRRLRYSTKTGYGKVLYIYQINAEDRGISITDDVFFEVFKKYLTRWGLRSKEIVDVTYDDAMEAFKACEVLYDTEHFETIRNFKGYHPLRILHSSFVTRIKTHLIEVLQSLPR